MLILLDPYSWKHLILAFFFNAHFAGPLQLKAFNFSYFFWGSDVGM